MGGSFYSADTPDSTWKALAEQLVPRLAGCEKLRLQDLLSVFEETPGEPFAKALMADFSRRVAAEFATEAPAAQQAAPAPLAAHSLLWQVIKAQLARFARWLGLAAA